MRKLTMSFAIAAGVCFASCSSPPDVSDEHFYQDFVRDAQTMQNMGLPVYWLGREFTAGDLTFRGPYGGDFGGEVQGGGMKMEYAASLEPTPSSYGATLPFEITIYSQAAWALVSGRILNPETPGTTHRSVTILGKQAEMFSAPGGTRPLNALWLVLDLGDVTVVVGANAGGPVTPVTGPLQTPGGPAWSPFINDPNLLVQVLQNLRPYPQ